MADSRRSNCGSHALIQLTSISLVECPDYRPVPLRIDLPLAAFSRAYANRPFYTSRCALTAANKLRDARHHASVDHPWRIESIRKSFCGEEPEMIQENVNTHCPTCLLDAIPLLPCCPLTS